jgi:hypothetical protein
VITQPLPTAEYVPELTARSSRAKALGLAVRYAALRSRGLAGHPGHLSASILLIAVLGVLALALTGGTLSAAAGW